MNKIINILNKDLHKNINLINFINNQEITYTKSINDSVLIKGISDEEWTYISVTNEAELIELLKETKEDQYFFFEEWVLPFVANEDEIEWKLTCEKLILPNDIVISEPKTTVEPLQVSDAKFIQENHSYSDYTDIEYIEERIKNGTAYGIRENGQLVAWALTHDDGAIGFLRVLPEYQSKGYAKDVTNKIILELRKKGLIPFVHIEKDNIKSINLSKKVGFIHHSTVVWIKRK